MSGTIGRTAIIVCLDRRETGRPSTGQQVTSPSTNDRPAARPTLLATTPEAGG